MIAIVLGILKIIGILLLILLGLVLFVIFSVLFVPIRYRAEGSFYEHLEGEVLVSWFLRLLELRVSYHGTASADVRILWFHPWREKKRKPSENEEEELLERVEATEVETPSEPVTQSEQKLPEKVTETPKEESFSEAELGSKPETASNAEVSCEEETLPETEKTPERTETTETSETEPSRVQNIIERIKKLFQTLVQFPKTIRTKMKKMVQRFQRIGKKLQKGKAQWDTILAFLQDEENKKTFRLAKKQIFAILRHILPQKMDGKLRFGLGDPYMTGQVLTWISPFYGLYGRTIQVTPDFLELCLEGELKLKGRIRIGTLLFLGFRMLRDKKIRLWIKKWREA